MTWLVEHKEILKDYRHGRPAAWSAIYEHYTDDLRRFVTLGFSFNSRGRTFRFAGYQNPLDVDDVVQESFVRAFSESARLNYDGLHSFQNYLFAIARNVVLRDFRKEVRTVALDDPEREGEQIPLGEEDPSPEQVLISAEAVQLVRDFRQQLSHYDQRFFELRFLQQLSQDDTAKRLRLTRARVRTLEQRVRKRLLRFLRQRRYLAGDAPAVGLQSLLLLLGAA